MSPDTIPPEIGLPVAAVLWAVVVIGWIRDSRKGRR